MKFIIGTKQEMTQKFQENGTVVSVTAIKVGPNTITQIKGEKDGYTAVQVGYGLKRSLTKALLGHLKGLPQHRTMREFRVDSTDGFERGKMIDITSFEPGDKVKVTGISKGKGFQGVVKRHGFHGSPATHGHKDQLRMPGSIGAGGVQHVFKGTRMGGRMGGDQVTTLNVEIAEVDPTQNIIYVNGSVPGARNSLVILQADGAVKFVEPQVVEPTVAETAEEVAVEAPTADGKEEMVADKVEVPAADVSGDTPVQADVATATEEPKQNIEESK